MMRRLLCILFISALFAMNGHAQRIVFQQRIAEGVLSSKILFLGNFAFINTDKGILRGPAAISPRSTWDLVLAQPGISHLTISQKRLLAMKMATQESVNAPASDRSIQVTRDFGATFSNLDNGLERCSSYEGTTWCRYNPASHTQLRGETIVTNVGGGGSIAVSKDGGATYTSLDGSPIFDPFCYFGEFTFIGPRQILKGGECPLDAAYLQVCTVDSSLSRYLSCEDKAPADYGNRKVNALYHIPGSPIILVGGEGNILRSPNQGRSFTKTLWDRLDKKSRYRYVEGFHYSKRHNIVFAWGFDKGVVPSKPVILLSSNNGRTWRDISSRVRAKDSGARLVTSVHSNRAGELYITTLSTLEEPTSTLKIFRYIP
jgi:photosystem II stability/assembly factor-like uncharacterized protein